tara:strand:+ start:8997 stop:9371 length:375 start_codon:yes stop_codon:yes gene_type:complete
MTYFVNDKCIKCKYTDCVAVCPVDCFYEGENMLVINPDECIDCGVCEPECPAGAIFADTDIDPARGDEHWLKLNDEYSRKWPVLTQQKDPMPDADSFNPEMEYIEDPENPKGNDFTAKPGPGDE